MPTVQLLSKRTRLNTGNNTKNKDGVPALFKRLKMLQFSAQLGMRLF